jgi:hypothetical protein
MIYNLVDIDLKPAVGAPDFLFFVRHVKAPLLSAYCITMMKLCGHIPFLG